MTTNIQAFSGDVEITSNVLLSSNVFIKGPGPTSNVVAIGIEAGYDTQGTDSIAIGTSAGQTSQGANATALGYEAGQTSQGAQSVAVGRLTGETSQGANSVAVGNATGQTSQGASAVAVGLATGAFNQGNETVAIGLVAGKSDQTFRAVAIGAYAGECQQGDSSIAIGRLAGQISQGVNAIAIGRTAGYSNQGDSTVAIGYDAGRSNHGFRSVAIGQSSGSTNQGSYSVGIGFQGGKTNQGIYSVAIGNDAGSTNQGTNSVAIGNSPGQNNQGDQAVAIGRTAGRYNQGGDSIAIGWDAGETDQGVDAVAIGFETGQVNQGAQSVAIGDLAGQYNQANDSVGIGYLAGRTYQLANSVAIGAEAGRSYQSSYAVAIGFQAAYSNQESESVAVGTNAQRNNLSSGNKGTATAVGPYAGCNAQEVACTAVGQYAGRNSQRYYAQAFGFACGQSNQAHAAVAVGQSCGNSNQGTKAVALGVQAGVTGQSAGSIVIHAGNGSLNGDIGDNRFLVSPVRSDNSGSVMRWNSSTGEVARETSDDRLKDDEKLIRNALSTIMKLKPQVYEKRADLDPQSETSRIESGHMAQDIYYDTPELRHLVFIPDTANPTPEKPPAPSGDPRDDPDYSAWGKIPTDFDKEGLIPYLVRGIQELNRELTRSKTTVSNTWGQNISSLVVSADTNKHKTNTTPIVSLSTINNDKSWYGVVSDEVVDTDDYDTLINVKGDTRIWVVDTNGSLESGDLLTTSNISPGYTQKQDDNFIRNYTVAKMTQECDFTEPTRRPVLRRKQQLIDVKYYLKKQESVIDYDDYIGIADENKRTTSIDVKYRKPDATGSTFVFRDTVNDIVVDAEAFYKLPESQRSKQTFHEISEEEYNALTAEEKDSYTRTEITVYKRILIFESKLQKTSHPIEEIRQEFVDVFDENGQIVWEETGETEPVYTLVDHGTYKAALVTCKLI